MQSRVATKRHVAQFANYMSEFRKIDLKYLKEAFNEPLNFLGLVSFGIVGVYTFAAAHEIIPLAAGLAAETVYLVTVPASSFYRRLVDRREKQRRLKLRDQQRESAIKLFDPREREAVEYLRWLKNQIYADYKKSTNVKEIPSNILSLDQRWEDFVDLLDVYRRRKHHLNSIDRKAVQNQLIQAERLVEYSQDDREKRIQQSNVEILKRRVAAFQDIERSLKLVEAQLQSIEYFFSLVRDQVISLPTPERVSALDFEQLSDSIAMTKQMLEETSDTFAALDSHNRDVGKFELLLSNSSK